MTVAGRGAVYTADPLSRVVVVQAEDLRRLAYANAAAFPVLFDSAATGALGQYSILAAYPEAALWRDAQGGLQAYGLTLERDRGFLAQFEDAWRSCAVSGAHVTAATHTALPGRVVDTSAAGAAGTAGRSGAAGAPGPFRGGWVVFLGYELAAEIEPQLPLPMPPAADHAPSAFALRIPAALVYDHAARQGWALAEAGRETLLQRLEADLAALSGAAPLGPQAHTGALSLQWVREEEEARFRSRVAAALEYIRAGEIYQANLSRRWRARLEPQAGDVSAALYERLRAANPAPFGALAQFQDWRLLCSSPERLVRVRGARIETRPIAGTRPRSRLGGEDLREAAALIANPKERAEHVMLLDLERNDLGRICRAGTVHVDEFMTTESYAHVHHIVSNVGGELLPGLSPVDVLRAMFPGGTITGCPKFRCMQIIAELEAEARGAYTGALGFVNHDGSMDFNILIRSITLQGGALEFRAGAGIVADSDAQRELQETRAKARGLLAALESA